MKKILTFLLLLSTPVFGDFITQLDAGRLRLNSATPMPAGSLLILVAAGGDGTFSNTLASGQYASGNDILLSVFSVPSSAADFNTSGGPDETLNTFTIDTDLSGVATGDLVALRWFPQITYAQFQLGITPTAGQNYGTYNPLMWGNLTNNPDPGDPWSVPTDGAAITYDFFTTDSEGGGTQNPLEGYASFIVVPEPSSFAMVSLALVAGAALRLRRRRFAP